MQSDLYFSRCFYMVCLWILTVQILHAQYEEKDFIRYTVKDGLSDNNITCLQQDHRGFMWIGTNVGLNQFDGHTFKNYYQDSPENFLASSDIRKLKSIDDNYLGIISSGGFQLLNTFNFQIQNYFVPDTSAFVVHQNRVWDAVQFPDGSFGISSATGFYVYNPEGKLTFRYDAFDRQDIGIQRILYGRDIFTVSDMEYVVYTQEIGMAVYHDGTKTYNTAEGNEKEWKPFSNPSSAEGGPWLFKAQLSSSEFIFCPNGNSISYYDHGRQKYTQSPLPFKAMDEFNWSAQLCLVNDSTLLIHARDKGFFRFHLDRVSGRLDVYPEKFLPSHKINCLFQDKDHRLWAGTSTGLLCQSIIPPLVRRFTWPVEEKGNSGFVDACMHKGRLYLARFDRDAGLLILDSTTMKLVKEISFYGKDNTWNEMYSMEMYSPDTLWLGSNEGLLWFDTKSERYGKVLVPEGKPGEAYQLNILAPAGRDGNAWLLDWLGGMVARYNISSKSFTVFNTTSHPPLPFVKVKSIAYDAYGDVWIGGHSLTRWNTDKQMFDILMSVYGGSNKFNEDILTMSADANGSLWIHNADNGLLQFKIKENQFVSFGIKDGLPSNVLTCLSPVYDHKLFIGSHNHLTRLDTRSHEIEIYADADELPELLTVGRAIFLDTMSRMGYAFYRKEIVRFPMDPPSRTNMSGELLIQELVINQSQSILYPDDSLRLKPGDHNLVLHYTVIDFEDSDAYQFSYKVNNDNHWTGLGKERFINLTSLDPGFYNVQLSATGKSGDQKIKTFSFNIAPPFWKTNGFILACLILFSGLVYFIYKWRIQQVKQKANLDKLLSQTEMKALHAQMNPHFIFNSLNSIREMILNNENQEASKFLSKFAHLIRVTLDQSRQSVISLRNTMDYITRYVEMEKIRNARFSFSMSADPVLEPDETVMPPMLIQPFIENAIWHGTNGDGKMVDIKVTFRKIDDQLECLIEDNGIGILHSLQKKNQGDQHQSIGIDNIKNRIELLNKKYEMQSTISVKDKSELGNRDVSGTLVTITLPLEMIEE